jgi:hypothetical protein
MTRAEMVLEMLAYSPLSYLTRLLAREHFIQFSRHEGFKLFPLPALSSKCPVQEKKSRNKGMMLRGSAVAGHS